MAVKFPLEMKDGIKVRNISELKEHFDIEKVVGYFLDGKLKNWLEARYYEEESEVIENLEATDPYLAKKLSDVFGVPYSEGISLDLEEIAKKNERISKLKQLTTDSDILNQVDSVAFDQEELAELYDKGVNKIILCEGSFEIPKSKCGLDYVLVANPNVKGLYEERKEEKGEAIIRKETCIYDVPVSVTDKIGVRKYLETTNYLFYRDDFSFYKYCKKSHKEEKVSPPKRYEPSLVGDKYYFAYDDSVVMEAHANLDPGYILLYNLSDNSYKEYSLGKHSALEDPIINEKKLVYYHGSDVKLLDFCTGESEFCFESDSLSISRMFGQILLESIFYKNRLYVYDPRSNDRLCAYNLDGDMRKEIILKYPENTRGYCDAKFFIYEDDLYLIEHQEAYEKKAEGYGIKISRIDVGSGYYEKDIVLELPGENIGVIKNSLTAGMSKYIPFVRINDNGALHLFDLETRNIKRISTECVGRWHPCNHYQIVCNYLYYEKGTGARLYRVDVKTGREMPVH